MVIQSGGWAGGIDAMSAAVVTSPYLVVHPMAFFVVGHDAILRGAATTLLVRARPAGSSPRTRVIRTTRA
jgi:hypothetical protein